jgi:hypothetical protein
MQGTTWHNMAQRIQGKRQNGSKSTEEEPKLAQNLPAKMPFQI